jgi:REP element-mobilizing transposase RayT
MPNQRKPAGDYLSLVQGVRAANFGEVTIRNRGRLPHWEMETGVYFVTFRLGDSLPPAVLAKMAERKRRFEEARNSGRKLLPHEVKAFAQLSARKIEEYLDAGLGACYLRDPRVAQLVADALRFWEGKRYRLRAWCIMPNHVHVVFRVLPGEELARVLRSWKSYTAHMANRILGRAGTFWQREYYDRLIRNAKELERAVEYVRSNPLRAGLKDWKWVWIADE